MKANRRKGRKGSRKRRTPAQVAATKKLVALNKRRSRKSGSPAKRRKFRRNYKKGTKLRGKALATARKNLKKARAAKKHHGGRKRTTTKGRKRSSSKKGGYRRVRVKGGGKRRKNIVKALNARAKKHRKRVRYFENEGATPNRRRRHTRKHYSENRRHRRTRKHYAENRRRRHYRRNVSADWKDQIKNVAMIGVSVTVGFFAHRALTYVVSEKLLATMPSFQSGSMGKYRGMIGGLFVALVGIPLAAKAAPKHAAAIGSGMIVSLLHKSIVQLLTDSGQTVAAGYLSGYADQEGVAYRGLRGFGADPYMQAAAGYGEYMATNGFGAPPFMQAAAGYGASPYLQAAAGYGAPPFMQAAAGMGEYMASNGVGEYVAQGLRGIGEYEATSMSGPGGSSGGYLEGINPDVSSAELALTQAEQMSGIGDIPTGSIWQATQMPDSVEDTPRGARAGILEGSGGIFG